ncbi:MAG: response regulator [Oxalobacteraceae bacterium]|nr:MAG: response regulator [Oxalobacteraceae bacterium]
MPDTKKHKLLIVDDEPLYLEMASDQLSVDFDILTAGSVDEALALLKTNSVDAVLSDYRMTPKNGLVLLRHLTLTHHPALRVLITANSAAALSDTEMKGVQLDELADKPLALEDFIPVLLKRLDSRTAS